MKLPTEVEVKRCWWWKTTYGDVGWLDTILAIRNPLHTWIWRCRVCDETDQEWGYRATIRANRPIGRKEYVTQQAMKHALWFHCPKTWLAAGGVTNPAYAGILSTMWAVK